MPPLDLEKEDAHHAALHLEFLKRSQRRNHKVPRDVILAAFEGVGCDPFDETALQVAGVAADTLLDNLVKTLKTRLEKGNLAENTTANDAATQKNEELNLTKREMNDGNDAGNSENPALSYPSSAELLRLLMAQYPLH